MTTMAASKPPTDCITYEKVPNNVLLFGPSLFFYICLLYTLCFKIMNMKIYFIPVLHVLDEAITEA